MTQLDVVEIGSYAVITAMKLAAPALLAIMVTGFFISIFQAATQINEQTLSFIPKVIIMSAALFFSGPWLLQTIIFFTTDIFNRIPHLVHGN